LADDVVIQSRIDTGLLDRIEQECCDILYRQRLLYNERWASFLPSTRLIPILRLLGLLLSILGIALSVLYLVYPSSCPRWFFAEAYLLFFVLAGALFFYLPRIDAAYRAWFKTTGKRGCQKQAGRMLAHARKQTPFDAKYEVNGDRISYARGRDDQWQPVWSRQAKGFALLGRNATLLFRKPTSLVPTMLVLHHDREAMESVLKGLGMAYQTTV
jgi:hypothetical protein